MQRKDSNLSASSGHVQTRGSTTQIPLGLGTTMSSSSSDGVWDEASEVQASFLVRREYMQRRINAMDYKDAGAPASTSLQLWERHLRTNPAASCPSPPAAGPPCSVCHQSAFSPRALEFCSVPVQWRIEHCQLGAIGLGLLLQVLLKHVYPLISSPATPINSQMLLEFWDIYILLDSCISQSCSKQPIF